MTSMSKGSTPENYVRELRLRSPVSAQVYRSILNGFQRFVAEQAEDKSVSQTNDTAVAQGSNPGVAVPHSHGSCGSCRPFSGLEGKQPSTHKQSIRRLESGVWTTHDHTGCAGTVES